MSTVAEEVIQHNRIFNVHALKSWRVANLVLTRVTRIWKYRQGSSEAAMNTAVSQVWLHFHANTAETVRLHETPRLSRLWRANATGPKRTRRAHNMPMKGRQAVLGIADMNASVMHRLYAYTKLMNDVRQTMTSLLDQTHIFAWLFGGSALIKLIN